MHNAQLNNPRALQSIRHEGRTYTFRLLDQDGMTEWEAWLIGRARRAICAIYQGEEQARHLADLHREAMAGVYDFTGELSRQALATPGGCFQLASILCDCDRSQVLALVMARREECLALLHLALAQSFPGAAVRAGAGGEGVDLPRPGEGPEGNG